MKFSEIVQQTVQLLQTRGRVTYRALKREFDLDDDALADLKDELLFSDPQVKEEGERGLVWVGEQAVVSSPHPPISYTPVHLADRIRAVTVTDGERKTITALFADLKGSTALIEGLDPEEARAVIDPALQLMMDAVHQYDGFVAQALGDGIFALFGAPLAHEDHPQRALYAALRMQESMRRYADTLRAKGYPPLLMRVGINTGEVVLRSIRKDDLHADYVPVGHSTNLAARMEQLAAPGSIVASAYTHRLTDGYFAFKDFGPTQIKGVEDALNIYEVLGAGPLRTRLQVSVRRGLTRFVGRQSEMEQLQQALEQAKAGHGQIVGTMGEPGLGKSRLFYEFKLLSLTGCLVLEAYSVSHGKATAYLPVIELLKSYFDIQAQDDERKRREKVTGKVLNLDRSLEDTLPYLFALLGIEEQPSPLAQMDAQIRRRRTFEALKKLFLRESLNQPLVLIFEDLHWIDGETQGFLDVLSESVASAKLLLLTNYRPEYRHEWGQKTYYTQLRLALFGREEAEEFLDSLLSDTGSPLPRRERDRVRVTDNHLHALKQLILDKTQGTPFFMEEVVQTLAEDGTLTGTPGHYQFTHHAATQHGLTLQIPSTVQAILAARIDRLAPDEKALLQQLSVIGREFPLSLIRQVIPQPEADLYRLLASLQRKEFLYEQPAFPEVEYIFKHALTQEVAYGTVLQERRKVLHEQTGRAIEQLYTETVEEHYEELAHHYQRSGNTEKAIAYAQQAGRRAAQRSAQVEAVSYLRRGLTLLETLPETPERDQQELALQAALGPVLMATQGFGAPESGATYRRAAALCQQLGETAHHFPVLYGLRTFRAVRAEHPTARTLGEQLLHLAEQAHDPTLLVVAHGALGMTLFNMGEFVAARRHCEQSVAHYDAQQHRALAIAYGQDPAVTALAFEAWALWVLGSPEQAVRQSQASVTLARGRAHPFSLAYALAYAAFVHLQRREWEQGQEQAEAALALASEHGFPVWVAAGTILRGRAVVAHGHATDGIAQMRGGIAAMRATGAEAQQSHCLGLLAEAYLHDGQIEEGLATVAEALAFVERTEERYYEAEVWRIKGQLVLQSHSPQSEHPNTQHPTPSTQAEAEACFLKAIEIAQKQQAKSLELRAVMSLVRLRQRQAAQSESRNTDHGSRAKLDEAHRMLSEVYNWFTEGFDTKDLQEAKALLDELAEGTV